MKTFGRKALVAGALGALLASTTAHAELFDRGGGMVYDSTRDITWLANWNQGAGSSFDDGVSTADGAMTWDNANAWANNLVFGGYDDWRLPTSLNADGTGPCLNWGCSGSEMGHMFYDNWGATAGEGFALGTNATSLGMFSNVKSERYWSDTVYVRFPDRGRWTLATYDGNQMASNILSHEFYAVAVRAGDVTPVPEPRVALLAIAGLCVLVMARRTRPR